MPIVSVEDHPDVLAIVPTLGGSPERVAACVRSLLDGSGGARLAVLVICNSSTIGPETLAQDGVRVVSTGLNLGWAGGLRFGADLTESPYLWWMQDDVVVQPTTLAALLAALDDTAYACASPLQVENGLVVAGSCGGVFTAEGKLSEWLPATACAPNDLPDLTTLSYRPSRALLVRRAAFDAVGGPNPRLFPAQFVDADFGFRLAAGGFTAITVPNAHIAHGGGASTPSALAQFLHGRNAHTFGTTWFAGHPEATDERFVVSSLRPDDPLTPPVPVNPAISRDLVDAVAQSASDALTHLGRAYTERLAENATHIAASERARESEHARADAAEARLLRAEAEREQAARDLAAVRESTAWRITAPLRWAAGLLRR